MGMTEAPGAPRGAESPAAHLDPSETPAVRRSIRIETEAVIAALCAAVAGGIYAAVQFWGHYTPIWASWGGEWTVGATAVTAVVVAGLAACVISHRRASRLPENLWRRSIPLWRSILDTAAVALMHTALAVLAAGTAFFVAQHAFRRLTVGQYVGTSLVTITTALATYVLYLSVARLTTVNMAHRLLLFMVGGVLLSMETTSDPVWWRYYFSALGTYGNPPSIIFNATLIVSGTLVAAFALYIERDLETLHRHGVLRYRWSPPLYSTLFVLLGVMFAGIGLVPINTTIIGHNIFSGGTSLLFAILLVTTPVALRGLPWPFLVLSLGFLVGLVSSAWLHFGIGLINLTAFELVAFAALFGWIVILVRFVALLLGRSLSGSEDPEAEDFEAERGDRS